MDTKNIINIKEDNKLSYVGYIKDFISVPKQQEIFEWLENMNDFKSGMTTFGKEIPRLQKWYQSDNKYFAKEWKVKYNRWESHKYDDYLLDLQRNVNKYFNKELNYPNFNINSCLINKYRNGYDSIKPHRDNLLSFGPEPIIGILSIGCPRDILFYRVKYDKNNPRKMRRDKEKKMLNRKITLESGSMLIMSGTTQKYYSHEIPKTDEKKNIRYSLTFREYIL